jgi:hypothetical protein
MHQFFLPVAQNPKDAVFSNLAKNNSCPDYMTIALLAPFDPNQITDFH